MRLFRGSGQVVYSLLQSLRISNNRTTTTSRDDLISIKTSGKNRILDSILYPNREVQPQYISYEIETTEGESVVGLIAQESRSLMVVKQAGGITQTIQRQKIASIDGTGNSIMP